MAVISKNKNFFMLGLIVLTSLLFFICLLSITVGAVPILYSEIKDAFFSYDIMNSSHIIIREARLPRMLLTLTSGAGLSVSGALMQGITRNPIASPSTLGIDAGAMLGLCFVMAFSPISSNIFVYFSVFLGAAVATFLIYILGTRVRGADNPIRLALAGAAVSALFTAIGQGVAIYKGLSQSIFSWNNSGLAATQMNQVLFAVPFVLIGLALSLYLSPSISVLSFGDEMSINLGKKVWLIKLLASIAVLILTGTSIALVGTISYIGLIIPHLVRLLVGYNYKWIIPYSAVAGAIIVCLSDILARTINPPYEIPVNAITSAIGVPFFLYLIIGKNKAAQKRGK